MVGADPRWIGSLVKYEQRVVCFSGLFAPNDKNYTDQVGDNNDECEYYGNGIISNDKLYIQSYVFDASFEIEFNFEKDLIH